MDLPSADQIEGAPHPRHTQQLFGHNAPWEDAMAAFEADRFHQGWILSGPKGVGKATFAYQLAAFLLTRPNPNEMSMFADADKSEDFQNHPTAALIRAGSAPGLYVLKRPNDPKTGKLKSVITVEDVRAMRDFFALSAGGNGRRVVIVDAADDLNVAAANALLKSLEEPPALAAFLLVTHQPSRLLPTIKSRCRTLTFAPLGQDHVAQALALASPETRIDTAATILGAGSVGATLNLAISNGTQMYGDIVSVMAGLPNLDRGKALSLADKAKPDTADQIIDLLELFLTRLARSVFSRGGVSEQAAANENDVFARLCPTQQAAQAWADLHLQTLQQARQGRAVNLDPSTLILDTLFKMEATAIKILR